MVDRTLSAEMIVFLPRPLHRLQGSWKSVKTREQWDATTSCGRFGSDGRSLWTARSLLPLSGVGSLLPGGQGRFTARSGPPSATLAADFHSPGPEVPP